MTNALDPNRTIYPSPTLRLVAFELRFPEVGELSDETRAAFDSEIKSEFPIPGPVPQEFTIELQKSGKTSTRSRTVGIRKLDRTKSNSVVLTPQNLVVETSKYERFETFKSYVELAVNALKETVEVPAMTRVGLRYIDEIDSSSLPDGSNWDRFINSDLLVPLTYFDPPPEVYSTQARFDLGEQFQLACKFGISDSAVVNHNGPLAISGEQAGSRFVIDLDSSWNAGLNEMPELDTDLVMETSIRLHSPVRTMFENSITEQLREEVLRKAKS